jgi:uncharacterized iron-regulated membrane protein
MKDSFRQSMAWLHTWAGLIAGWLLFVIFVAGTLACFDKELDYWMRPALHQPSTGTLSMDAAFSTLRGMAPHAAYLFLRPPSTRDPSVHGSVFEPGKPYIDVSINPVTGHLVPNTIGGNFFFVLHYNLQAGNLGVWLVGLVGMMMLVALISGVIIHKRIFKDFFVFRPRNGGQRAWLDGHNFTAVLGLPFHLMIAYTGVAIMVFTYMTAGVRVGYGGDIAKFYNEIQSAPTAPLQHQPPTQLASLDAILADAVKRFDGPVLYLEVQNPQDASARVSAVDAGNNNVAGGQRTLFYDGVTGAYLSGNQGKPDAYHAYDFLSGLHRVQFGGAEARWLYFLLGLSGCVMLACGMHVWVLKRIKQASLAGLRSGYGLVQALNVGVVAGMPLACVVPLWLNRLLPPSAQARADWESYGFWLAWIMAAVWAIARLKHGRPWRELFAATAALLLALPLLDAITNPQGSLLHSLARHDFALAGVDLTALALGLGFAWLAGKCGQPRTPKNDTRERDAARATDVSNEEEALS